MQQLRVHLWKRGTSWLRWTKPVDTSPWSDLEPYRRTSTCRGSLLHHALAVYHHQYVAEVQQVEDAELHGRHLHRDVQQFQRLHDHNHLNEQQHRKMLARNAACCVPVPVTMLTTVQPSKAQGFL